MGISNPIQQQAAAICGFQDLAEDLAAGRVADMTVLSADPFNESWDKIEVVSTIIGGRIVFGPETLLEEI